ncbi:hypothetical protein JMJ77_0011355 [Colletotrichum scovillei]|uniref:Uncharacterized protein n=1 Tax=Colletotrichum scovillei TaxID=1209932 RepID=A0A9P7R1U3_9PEZI|nr:hypothetical protein JMJ77_0011355 [Colletotrichum scovillei]KAG7060339.1 hypothetical protein JMJ78_0015614 [Colletotrichum scovillei]KAG7067784.1 hypothetical protein JMJ76_0009212 [Colletotrichum scovillei]
MNVLCGLVGWFVSHFQVDPEQPVPLRLSSPSHWQLHNAELAHPVPVPLLVAGAVAISWFTLHSLALRVHTSTAYGYSCFQSLALDRPSLGLCWCWLFSHL